MSGSRPDTPAPVKRQLRQNAGFGCCRCGFPVIQYHHIVEYAAEPHFDPDDMMALCPSCHDMATRGALPESKQRTLKASPYNIERGLVDGQLTVTQEPLVLALGSCVVINNGAILVIDQVTVLAVTQQDGSALLSIDLRDENGDQLLYVVENEWIAGSFDVWDLQASYQHLTVHAAARDIRLSIDLRPIPAKVRGQFWHGGRMVAITRDGIADHTGTRISGLGFVRLAAHFFSDGQGMMFAGDGQGGGGGMIVSQADPIDLYVHSVNAFRGNDAPPSLATPQPGA
jgi:hypothetical protein